MEPFLVLSRVTENVLLDLKKEINETKTEHTQPN